MYSHSFIRRVEEQTYFYINFAGSAFKMTQKTVKFDDILKEIGEFGKYQIFIYTIMCFFEFVVPLQTFSRRLCKGK